MNVGQIGELIKGIVTYFIPIASFILSIYSIYRRVKYQHWNKRLMNMI